ncbi:hypothetical protein SDC9_151632 [bioreactor metagenome]|uniref:Uncharacterized protein n=1 Tax=bioreactor metagenome TaxID=1076179 RepID=A0A645EV88_9ZZZZ
METLLDIMAVADLLQQKKLTREFLVESARVGVSLFLIQELLF